MPTLAPTKKPRRKPAASRAKSVAKAHRYSDGFWPGYAEGKILVAPGVDLTKPTLPPGKYL